jgi:predicted dehydrogenase
VLWGTEGILKLDLELMSLVRPGRKTLGRGTVAGSGLREAGSIVRDLARTAGQVVTRRYRNTHDHLIAGFVDAIRFDRPPPVPGEEGREAVRVMDLIAERLGG